MIWGLRNGERIFANPLIKDAICPSCQNLLIAKCGRIKVWHWAHKNLEECDSFHEPETEWHLNWKKEFPKECQEVIMTSSSNRDGNGQKNINWFNEKKHIADVKIKDIVVEFQNSPISPQQIKEREDYYGRMKWVLNGKTHAKNLNLFKKNDFFSFKWKWFPKSWAFSNRPIYIDMQFRYQEYLNKFMRIKDVDDEETYDKLGKTTEWVDYADGNSYPRTVYFYYPVKIRKDKELYQELMQRYDNKLFLIRKLSPEGVGWGKLISKEVFLKECENGYYPN